MKLRAERLEVDRQASSFTLARRTHKQKVQVAQESYIVEWLERVLEITKPSDIALLEWLRNGVILCRLLNIIHPGAINRYHLNPTARIQMIQNLNFFTSQGSRYEIFQKAKTHPLSVSLQSPPKSV